MKLTLDLSKPVKGFLGETLKNSATLDGYKFADRLLEGVMFKCDIISPTKIEITLLDESDEDYMSNLNSFKFFKIAGDMFVTSGGQNSTSRCLGLYDEEIYGDVYLLGDETQLRNSEFHFDIDTTLLDETGYVSYDGKVIDFKWEE